MSTIPRSLAGLRVLDLSGTVAGQFCGRLFADNGADVLLAEPAGGTPIRCSPPLIAARDGSSQSALFWHLNLGKSSVELDQTAGQDPLRAACKDADVVIVDQGVELTDLVETSGRPRVVCSITPFGLDGPFRNWRGSELVYQALAGVMFENGEAGRPPLYGVGHRASYAAGTIGYTQSLAVLLGGYQTRRRVDVSIAETAASMNFCRVTQYSYNGFVEGRDARTVPRAIARCADGWIGILIHDPRWRQSCRALGLGDMADDPRFSTERSRLAHWPEFTAALEEHLVVRSVADVVAAGQQDNNAVVAAAVLPSELWDDAQLRARGYWDWCDPTDGELPQLGPMFRLSATPQQRRPAAPRLGVRLPAIQDSTSLRPLADGRDTEDRQPLAGVLVADFTTAWAGPMATRILAALGARVVKVEGPARIDLWRGPVAASGLPSRYPDGVPGRRPYDRCYQFNTQNHDKESLVLDIKQAEGRALALDLASRADVVISNFRAGVMERLGFGWAALRERNERVIVVEMPGYGSGGPVSDHAALGPSIELMAGMGRLVGYGDGRPYTTGPAYLDPVGGFNAAAAILTALAARQHTGAGQYIEVAQREAAMHWIGEEVIAAVVSGEDWIPNGNGVRNASPHGAFRCAGDDQWVAIAAFDDGERTRLREVAGGDAEPPDDAASTADGASVLTEAIERWTATRDKHEVAAILQARGVHAAPVCTAEDLCASAFLRHRGLLQTVSHPAAGTHLYQGVPLHIEGVDTAIRQPAPCFAEHSDVLLHELLGVDQARAAALLADGVTARAPVGAAE
jgi:crotonobetainyl-CoA:carnitine CoA-transferase CaiB-like acyl-CoA transferase